LTHEEWTDMLSRNVDKELPLHAVITQNSAVLIYFAAEVWHHATNRTIPFKSYDESWRSTLPLTYIFRCGSFTSRTTHIHLAAVLVLVLKSHLN